MSTAPYEALAALGREELELSRAGDLDGVERVQAEKQDLILSLPDVPPPAALPFLRDAAVSQGAAMDALRSASNEVSGQLARAGTGRRAARAYTPHVQSLGTLERRG